MSWTPVSNAQAYHVIIKDANASSVLLSDVYDGESVEVSEGSLRAGNDYSITIGAVLQTAQRFTACLLTLNMWQSR